jgi:hypothetical protein
MFPANLLIASDVQSTAKVVSLWLKWILLPIPHLTGLNLQSTHPNSVVPNVNPPVRKQFLYGLTVLLLSIRLKIAANGRNFIIVIASKPGGPGVAIVPPVRC